MVRHPIGDAIVVPWKSRVKPRDFSVPSTRGLPYLFRCLICIPCYTSDTPIMKIKVLLQLSEYLNKFPSSVTPIFLICIITSSPTYILPATPGIETKNRKDVNSVKSL